MQDYIAAGQFRAGEQLLEAQNGGAARHHSGVPGAALQRGPRRRDGRAAAVSSTPIPAITRRSPHRTRRTSRKVALHVVDGVGLVHALLLRIQALLLPIQTLVLSGH